MTGRSSLVAMLALLPLGLSSAALFLLQYRVASTGTETYSFMTWNLMLAWIPVLLGMLTFGMHRMSAPLLAIAPILLLWLLFLPNSPYLVSDLIHVRQLSGDETRQYDHLLLLAFAASGLCLGCVALLPVHVVVRERFGHAVAWGAIVVATGASGVGVYLGRYLRLNSWDALTDPGLLPRLVAGRLDDPFGNQELLLVVGAFTALILLVYVPMYWAAVGPPLSQQRQSDQGPLRRRQA